MNSTKRYLPLSLVLVLVCSVSDAKANSALDPYAHVKAPSAKEQEKTAIPSVDSITTPTSYVTVNMSEAGEEKKSGLVGSMLGSITAPTKTIKKASSGMVSGTKAAGANFVKGGKMLGDGMAKGASVIGAGIMTSGEKFVDGTQAVGSKIANVVPGRSQSPHKTASRVSEMYENKAIEELAKVDNKEVAKQVAQATQDSKDKATNSRRSFLSLDKRSKSKVNPNAEPATNGFLEGALANEAKQKHDEVVGESKEPVKTIATKPLDAPKGKKKWGLGKISTPKIGLGLFKKDAPDAKAAPATEVASKSSEANDLQPQEPAQTQISAAPTEQPATQENEPQSFVANAGAKEDKKGKFGLPPISIGKGLSMPKLRLNPFSKKSKDQVNPNPESQTASKKDIQL